jgi:hypothetical protein
MIRTFLDSGVLIAAARATGALGTRALAFFNDSERVFVSSDFVRLEIFPKAIYNKKPHFIGFSGGQRPPYAEGSSALDFPLIHGAQSPDQP